MEVTSQQLEQLQLKTEETNKTIEESKQNKKAQEEELIADFSVMFKGKNNLRKMPKLSSSTNNEVQAPNWLLQIPAKLEITKKQLIQRRFFDQRRWKSAVKCGQKELQGTAASVTCWNYLFSQKGVGSLKTLTLNKGLEILKKLEIKYQWKDQFERQSIVKDCFMALCKHYGTQAHTETIIKPVGPNKVNKSNQDALKQYVDGLKDKNRAFVFITYDKVLCPFGFEYTPLVPLEAYKPLPEIKPENYELWFINGMTQKYEAPYLTKRWRDVKINLETVWPNYLDLQEVKQGVQKRIQATPQNENNQLGSSHCIIEFRKL